MAQSNNQHLGLELELEKIVNINDGIAGAAIHAQVIMNSKKNFAAGEISVKVFCMEESGPTIVSHQLLYDSKIKAIPKGRVAIELLTENIKDTCVTVLYVLTISFVFYEHGEEIIRYEAKFRKGCANPLRRWLEEGTTTYTAKV